MTKDELKIGDRVKVRFTYGSTVPGVITEVKLNGWCDVDFGDGCMAYDVEPHRIEKIEPTHKNPKFEVGDYVRVDGKEIVLDDTYWQHYRAELVKELALKLTDTNSITIPSTADLIVNFATRIVDNLKKQSNDRH